MIVASRMSCGTAPPFHQREQLVERLKEGRLAELRWPRVGCHNWEELSRLRKRLWSCQALQWWAQRQARPWLGEYQLGEYQLGINCLTQREFRVVIHPSVHLSLGVCNWFIGFEGAVFCFLKDLKPWCLLTCLWCCRSLWLAVFFQARSRWSNVWQCFELHCV